MKPESKSCSPCYNTDNSDANITVAGDGGDVPQKDSATVVLEFMAEHRVPMGPKSIYGGLLETRTINFKYRTVQNRLSELTDDGLLDRVRVDTTEHEVVSVEDEDARAYYLITEKGLREAHSGD